MTTDLYVHGGVYADVDVAPVVGLQAFVQPSDTFVTPGSQRTSWLNPVLIVARPREPLLKVTMQKMLHRYRTTDCKPPQAGPGTRSRPGPTKPLHSPPTPLT